MKKVYVLYIVLGVAALMAGTAVQAATTTPVISSMVALPSLDDSDKDGLTDLQEIALGTNPQSVDSDNDGYDDGTEVFNGYDPLVGGRTRASEKRVEVDLDTQTLSYFLGTVKLGSFPISSGIQGLNTPTGTFTFMRKVPVINYVGPGYSLPNTKWNIEFKRHFYVHGAYWHNQFGIRPMSHGCVNVAYKDMEGLYNFLDVGNTITIYGAIPKKPLVIARAL